MKTKKKDNEKETKDVSAASLWEALPASALDGLDREAYRVPRGARMRDLMNTANVLLHEMPAAQPPVLVAAYEGLRQSVAVTTRALEHNVAVAAGDSIEGGEARTEAIGLLSSIRRVLRALASVGIAEVAEGARAVERELFGAGVELRQLKSGALCTLLDQLAKRLADQPELRARLVARVPEVLLTQLFAAHERLARELGLRDKRRSRLPTVRTAALRSQLAERVAHLATVVVALAPPGDRDAIIAVRAQLAPLAELQARRPRARKAKPAEPPATTPS